MAWHVKKKWQKTKYKLVCLLVIGCLVAQPGLSGFVAAAAGSQNPGGTWVNPTDASLVRVGDSSPVQHELGLFSNLDCSLLTYRTVGSKKMQTGCFASTAFGMFDGSSAIFNGTDEALPLIPYSPNELLAPWPRAESLVAFDSETTGGWYISLYRGMAPLKDVRNDAGQLIAKKMTSPPGVHLKDLSGRPLIVNPQTIAFSKNGSWLVAETVYGYFVRVNLASLETTSFAASFNSPGGSSPQDAQVAVDDSGQYVAIANGRERALRLYSLAVCNDTTWRTNACQPHEYWPFAEQQIGTLTTLKHVRFLNDTLLSFETIATDPAGSSLYELSPDGKTGTLTSYLGLGDSYTSGEGAFDYIAGTDTAANRCHLSVHSYPLLLSSDVFAPAGGHSVACSGAVINDISDTNDTYREQVKGGLSLGEIEKSQPGFFQTIVATYSPGYIPQALFVGKYQPKVVTVSVGGNDIGFADILTACVAPHIGLHPHENTCYSTYESRLEVLRLIDRQIPRWIALYKQLHALSPGTTIYALGYPDVIAPTGRCGVNVHFNKSEAAFAEELVAYLDNDISQAAKTAGVQYINISKALVGHRLCETSGAGTAVNGLTSGTDKGIFGINVLGNESYHPNALGQTLIEQSILSKTGNFTSVGHDEHDSDASLQPILDVPHDGRPISNIAFDDTMVSGLIPRETPVNLHVDGLKDGLASNQTYDVHLDGPSGTILANPANRDSANLNASITLPAGVSSGNHRIDITGPGQAGEPLDIIQPIYIPNSLTDFDGDGVPNAIDTCPYAANSDVIGSGDDNPCDSFGKSANATNPRYDAATNGLGSAKNYQPARQWNGRQGRVKMLFRYSADANQKDSFASSRLTKKPFRAVLSDHIGRITKPQQRRRFTRKSFFRLHYFVRVSRHFDPYLLPSFFLIL